jgi:hypothetical protein
MAAPWTGFRIVDQVVRWALAEDRELDVVQMDEFTHDVVVGGDPILVFDCT